MENKIIDVCGLSCPEPVIRVRKTLKNYDGEDLTFSKMVEKTLQSSYSKEDIIEGIVIKEGKILEEALRSARLPVGDLSMLLRMQGIFLVKDVHFAVLETNGELSVFKKVAQQNATKQDVKAQTNDPKFMPCTLIEDGKIVKKNLPGLKITEEWVNKQLKKNGVNSVEQVFYAEIDTDGSVYMDLKDDNMNKPR